MNISGRTRIFKNDKGYYSTSLSNKKEDGTYDNMYITVQFPKGTELENNTEIEITKGFLSFYTNKEDKKVVKAIVQEYEGQAEINYNDDSLPF